MHPTHPTELAMDAALLVIQNGGSTVAAERSFANFLGGDRAQDSAALWRLDFVATTRRADGQSSTTVHPVGPIGVNLARASEVAALGERVARGEIALASVGPELERIRELPSPYGRWVIVLAAAVAAGCFTQILAGDRGSFGVAFVAAGVGQSLRSLLLSRKVPAAATTLACGLLSALIGALGLRWGLSEVLPAAMIASVFYLVPGLPLINGFIDVVSHRHLIVGLERIANAVFLFVLLAIAVAFAHAVAL